MYLYKDNKGVNFSTIGPVELDASTHTSQAISDDTNTLNHSMIQASLNDANNSSISTVTTANGEVLSAPMSSARPNDNSSLDSSQNVLMNHQNCLPSPSQLTDHNGHTDLMEQNAITTNQAASFLSYVQEHQGNAIGIGK